MAKARTGIFTGSVEFDRVLRPLVRWKAAILSAEVIAYGVATLQASSLVLPSMLERAHEEMSACHRHLSEITRTEVSAQDLRCPSGELYSVVPPGRTVIVGRGMPVLISPGRVALRCPKHPGVVFAFTSARR